MRKLIAIAALAAALLVGAATAVNANPGPGNSHACAPGQQGNNDPAFKPAACDH
jgi:hypothetical protein